MTEAEKIAIEWQCEKLCKQFANYSDENNFNGICQLFTPDGSYFRPSVPDREIKGRETLHAEFLKRPPLIIRHLVLNCVITVESPRTARGFSYIIYLSAPLTDEPIPLLAGPMHIGEFHDDFVLTDEGWQFKQRKGSLALLTA